VVHGQKDILQKYKLVGLGIPKVTPVNKNGEFVCLTVRFFHLSHVEATFLEKSGFFKRNPSAFKDIFFTFFFNLNMFQTRRSYKPDPGQALIAVLLLVGMFMAFFFIARSIFTILTWLTPFMVLLTVILDYRVIVGYFKWVWRLLNEQLLMGLGAVALTVFGYPVVAGYLLLRAWMSSQRKKDRVQEQDSQNRLGEYISFEEVDDRERNRSSSDRDDYNEYDHFFGR
jgi:hypothetical protein